MKKIKKWFSHSLAPPFIILLFLMTFIFRSWFLYRDWIPTEGLITLVNRYDPPFGSYYYQFSYNYENQWHEGDNTESSTRCCRPEVGKKITIRVNPFNPAEYSYGDKPPLSETEDLIAKIVCGGLFVWWILRWTIFRDPPRKYKKSQKKKG